MIRKNIDIDSVLLKKLMETAVAHYVKEKEIERYDKLTDGEKEDLGLLILMQQADSSELVSEEEVFKVLDDK